MSDVFEGTAGLVTGAGSGIGRASAIRMAGSGAYVVVADVDDLGGRETVDLIDELGGEAEFVRCDVTRASDVEGAVATVLAARGRLDWAHNNAGVSSLSGLHDLSEADFDRVIAINLKGVWLGLKYELALMKEQGAGVVVNTASVCGLRAAAWTSPYNATKHGVIGLTKEAAMEGARFGIRVNAVCPGYVTTPMSLAALSQEDWERMGGSVPLGRVSEPAEIAEAVAWLLSPASSYVNAHALVVDGGLIEAMPGPTTV